LVLENHSVDIDWWDDIVIKKTPGKIVQNGYIELPNGPGLGILDYNDEIIKEHINPKFPELWAPTDIWDNESSHDRLWS